CHAGVTSRASTGVAHGASPPMLRHVLLVLVPIAAVVACSGGASPQDGMSTDAGMTTADAAMSSEDAAPASDGGAAADACIAPVDDAGVTHGCRAGSMGPGDRDDGGGVAPPVSDASPDATDLPFGSPCLSGAQCTSG